MKSRICKRTTRKIFEREYPKAMAGLKKWLKTIPEMKAIEAMIEHERKTGTQPQFDRYEE